MTNRRMLLVIVPVAFGCFAACTLLLTGSGSHRLTPPPGLVPTASAEEYKYGERSFESSAESARHRAYYPAFAEYFRHLPAGASVIDLGCGNGSFLAMFQNRGWKLVGVDLSRSGVDLARKRYPGIRFELADATSDLSSFGYGQFDAVISTEVVEHVFLPRDYLRNCYRLLKPGGVLVITTPYHGYLKNLLLAVVGQTHARARSPLWDHGHVKFFSVETLSTMLFQAGFEQVEWRGLERVPYLWKGLLMKASVPRRKY